MSILETTTVKETLFSDFKGEIKAWAPGAVILMMVISESDPTAYFSEKVYDRHFLRRNDTNLNT
jgi:hypothetical protein